MSALIPVWIIGGPFIGLPILSFSFKGPSAMSESGLGVSPPERLAAERRDSPPVTSAPGGQRGL